jgi:hypothetical protein
MTTERRESPAGQNYYLDKRPHIRYDPPQTCDSFASSLTIRKKAIGSQPDAAICPRVALRARRTSTEGSFQGFASCAQQSVQNGNCLR